MNRSSVMILTGCASGIGLHLSKVLAKSGQRLMLTDLNFAALESLAETEKWQEPQVAIHALDVRNAQQWQAVITATLERWGQVDVLMNIAGYLRPGLIHETSTEEIFRHLEINAIGLMLGTQLTARQMVTRKSGHIINIASLAGISPVPGLALYSASKFAVRAFSLSVAQELKPHGVSVTVICPDAVQTPMLDLQVDYEEAALTFSGARPLTVEDIEHAILHNALKKKPFEIILPPSRGVMAKIASFAPEPVSRIAPVMRMIGRAHQRATKNKRR